MSHEQKVYDFMKGRQDLPDKPTVPSREIRELRARLILEESVETIKALGFSIKVRQKYTPFGEQVVVFDVAKRDGVTEVDLVERFEPDLVEIIDGCCDVKVVTTGTLLACGIDIPRFQDLVDDSNLAKIGPGSYKREDGKIMKPPGWKKPDIAGALEDYQEGNVFGGVKWLHAQ